MATTSVDQKSTGHLSRGQACFSCRRRKMAHPICGQCKRARRDADCEYINGQKRARAEILQENISQVESRIYELENPHLNHQPAVPLQRPYDRATAGLQASPQPSGSAPGAMVDEPPNDVVQKLVDSFIAYSSEFGFFLNDSRFRKSALLRQPIGHQARPSPALLWAVYLCGLRLSKQPQLIAQEPVFLSRALNLAATGLAGNHPQKVMHNLQAEILLAYYLFASGRFLEGKYHTAAAVSLGLSSGLHLIRSANSPSSVLPLALDAIEEGERIHACWAVMLLDKAWAVVLGENPHLDHQQQNLVVDTPWPLEMHDYEKIDLAKRLHQGQLSRTTRYFRGALIPPNCIPHPTPAMTRALVAAHSIAHTATIRLQSIPPLQAESRARRKRLLAATTVLNIIVSIPLHFEFINPIMGTVWLAASQVLVDEIYTVGTQRIPPPEQDEKVLLTRTMGVLSFFTGTCPLLSAL
ncbi:hypothetical protein K438DRAFT_1771091 [Mycena galopus ATCC 62051]|nr:hypothetical protein K438DRAFT_1771091 [Mycena galopus ATCC 62051]